MLRKDLIEGTLSGYAVSALDAAHKPMNRQSWTEQNSVFGGRQVGLM